MRLVHLSDIHLGYRQYQRLTAHGINQREADVARTFQRAVDRVIALRPDVILVAGDLFHSSRPSNAAILHAFRQFLRIRSELPEALVVMVAGDHDTPRTTESGNIMGLFEQIGIHVASQEPKRFRFPVRKLSILAVPDGPVPELTLDDAARYNVLLMHTHVRDVVPQYYAELDRASASISRAELDLSHWDYVALGHYHIQVEVAKNAFYSGSLDYTSLNVWFDLEESRGRKGFIEFDLETTKATKHFVELSREFLDLPAIAARDLTPAEVDAAIKRAVEKVRGGIKDKVVRLIIRDIPRQVSRELDHRALREYKKEALSFHVDFRKPEPTRKAASGAPTRRPSVVDVVREQLTVRPLAADLDREKLVDLGLKYLDEADAFPAPAAAGAESGS